MLYGVVCTILSLYGALCTRPDLSVRAVLGLYGVLCRDVVKGTNAIAKGGTSLKYGFDCTKGWDPATGVGTPDFGKLLAAAMGSAP